MKVRLEHANLCVRNVDGMVKFLQTAFPDFRIRGGGKGLSGQDWVHVGTDETYIALSPAKNGTAELPKPYAGEPRTNHLAYEVDDVDSLRDRLLAGGYQESTIPNKHPHRKRIYFFDPEGNDWEFVQYFSDDPAERNDYDLPDN